MSPESVLSNEVCNKLDQLKLIIDVKENNEKLSIDNISFLNTFTLYVGDNLKLLVPQLIQEQELQFISNEINNGINQMNLYFANTNLQHLTIGFNNFYNSLVKLNSMSFIISNSEISYTNEICKYQIIVKEKYDILKKVSLDLSSEQATTKEELNINKQNILGLEKTIITKNLEIQNVIIRLNAEFDALKLTANTTFELDRKKIIEDAKNDRKSFNDLFADQNLINKINFDEILEKNSHECSLKLKYLNEKMDEAKNIINIISNIGITGNYQKTANEHKSSADFFRWVTFGFMSVMVLSIIYSMWELSQSTFNFYKSIIRVIAAAVLSYPAIYAGKESTRHRNLETKNRTLELELASINPFIESLQQEKKELIKESLVTKYFGNSTETLIDSKDASPELSVSNLENIFKIISPFMKHQG